MTPIFSLYGMHERDLDVLLATHLTASETFRALLMRHALGEAPPHTVLSCQVSVSTDAGETDLLLVVRLDTENGRRIALMLEDKIGAAFQPEQADRYRQRGEQGILDGAWDAYRTCLVAPAAYIAKVSKQDGWNGLLALEKVAAWARAAGGPHDAVLARVCDDAVAKQAKASSEISPEATAFWQAYREAAAKLLPELTITRLPVIVSRASPWPRFGVGALPEALLLEHKPQQGRVDLTISAQSVERLQAVTLAWLPLGVHVTRAGGSAALRLAVPRVDHLRSFAEQEGEILAAFAAVEKLVLAWTFAASQCPTLERQRERRAIHAAASTVAEADVTVLLGANYSASRTLFTTRSREQTFKPVEGTPVCFCRGDHSVETLWAFCEYDRPVITRCPKAILYRCFGASVVVQA